MKTIVETLRELYAKLGGNEDVQDISTKSEMLMKIYEALGGEDAGDEVLTVSEAIEKVTSVADGGAGGGGLELIAEDEWTVSNATQTEQSKTISVSSTLTRTEDYIVFITIRDNAGPRAGYAYGSDSFITGLYKASANAGAIQYFDRTFYLTDSSGYFTSATRTGTYPRSITSSVGYGVYVKEIGVNGSVTVACKYQSAWGTIDGTYSIKVYKMPWPTGLNPFKATVNNNGGSSDIVY